MCPVSFTYRFWYNIWRFFHAPASRAEMVLMISNYVRRWHRKKQNREKYLVRVRSCVND